MLILLILKKFAYQAKIFCESIQPFSKPPLFPVGVTALLEPITTTVRQRRGSLCTVQSIPGRTFLNRNPLKLIWSDPWNLILNSQNLSCPAPTQLKATSCFSMFAGARGVYLLVCVSGVSCVGENGEAANLTACLRWAGSLPPQIRTCRVACKDDCTLTAWSKFSECAGCGSTRSRTRSLTGEVAAYTLKEEEKTLLRETFSTILLRLRSTVLMLDDIVCHWYDWKPLLSAVIMELL